VAAVREKRVYGSGAGDHDDRRDDAGDPHRCPRGGTAGCHLQLGLQTRRVHKGGAFLGPGLDRAGGAA